MLLKMIRLDSLFLSTIRRKLWLVAQKLRASKASNKANPYLASYTYRSKEAANTEIESADEPSNERYGKKEFAGYYEII